MSSASMRPWRRSPPGAPGQPQSAVRAMLEYLHLKNVGPAPEMAMEFAPRLNLITGDNGLGKSFLLDVAWWALTRRWPQELNDALTSGYPALPREPKKDATIGFRLQSKTKGKVEYTSTYAARDQAWVGKAGRPANPGLVIYAHADGGFRHRRCHGQGQHGDLATKGADQYRQPQTPVCGVTQQVVGRQSRPFHSGVPSGFCSSRSRFATCAFALNNCAGRCAPPTRWPLHASSTSISVSLRRKALLSSATPITRS